MREGSAAKTQSSRALAGYVSLSHATALAARQGSSGCLVVQQTTAVLLPTGTSSLDRDMFALIWGPTIAAVSVVLDHAEDQGIVQQCLQGLKLAAKMAAYHHVDEVSTQRT